MKKSMSVILIAVLFGACTSEKEKLADKIKENEKEFLNDSAQTVNRKKAIEIINLYKEYADTYKEDTISAEYLFRAGDISNGIGQHKEAITYYARCSDYNNYSKQPVAFFLTGFIYETQLNDLPNAKHVYEEFLQKYPDHKLSSDVKFSLENLGKSPEELIKMFEQKDLSEPGMDSATAKK